MRRITGERYSLSTERMSALTSSLNSTWITGAVLGVDLAAEVARLKLSLAVPWSDQQEWLDQADPEDILDWLMDYRLALTKR